MRTITLAFLSDASKLIDNSFEDNHELICVSKRSHTNRFEPEVKFSTLFPLLRVVIKVYKMYMYWLLLLILKMLVVFFVM